MTTLRLLLNVGLLAGLLAGRIACAQAASEPATSQLAAPEEKHLRDVRQLTFGGSNAEAYFSADGKRLIFQSTRDDLQCDQIFTMNVDGTAQKMVSTGKGRTTCGYIFPHQDKILYSSTHLADAACPPRPDYSKGYVWAVYPGFDIFTAKLDGSDLRQLTTTPGYDAEATISQDGKKIVFTSLRNGDLDIYSMDANGKHVKQLTHELGYDGGPFFSADRKWIVYRAYHPKTEQEIAEYKELLKQNLVRPTTLEIWIMKADGSGKRQLTNLNAASFAPSFFPDGKRIIFATNLGSTGGMGNFELYAINVDGTGLERITFSDGFDGFPMFSPDGKQLVWISHRNGKAQRETNVFIGRSQFPPPGSAQTSGAAPIPSEPGSRTKAPTRRNETAGGGASKRGRGWGRFERRHRDSQLLLVLNAHLRPTAAGVEMQIRYITSANDRYATRSRLYEKIVGLLRGEAKPQGSAPVQQN
jgi:Tol biopolymer transport system component